MRARSRVKYLIAAVMVGFVLVDSPYGEWAFYRAIGEGTTRPDWIAVPQSALIVTGARNGPNETALETGTVRYTTTMFDPQLSRFYAEALSRQGYKIDDRDMRQMGMATARDLGLRRRIEARDVNSGREMRVTIRKVDSLLFGHRTVQIDWSLSRPGAIPTFNERDHDKAFATAPNSF